MSSKEKLLKQITNAPKNVRFNDLKKLMEHYGFSAKQTRDGLLFRHDELLNRVNVPKPHGREKKVLKVYVDKCLEAIDMLE